MSELTVSDDASEGKRRSSTSISKMLAQPSSRRKSTFLKLSQGVQQNVHARRMTKALLGHQSEVIDEPTESKPKIRLENTYKMKPDEGTLFLPHKVRSEIIAVFEEHLKNVTYDPSTCGKLCCEVTMVIKNRIKAMNLPRHKVICNVFISQYTEQGMQVASRCLWDASTDSHACVTYTNNSLVAVGLVHGIFFE